jgi:hypothetical protein
VLVLVVVMVMVMVMVMVVPRYFVQLLFLLLYICPKGFSVPTRKELAAETTLAEKNPINNKTIKDGNGTALAFSSFLKLPAVQPKSTCVR